MLALNAKLSNLYDFSASLKLAKWLAISCHVTVAMSRVVIARVDWLLYGAYRSMAATVPCNMSYRAAAAAEQVRSTDLTGGVVELWRSSCNHDVMNMRMTSKWTRDGSKLNRRRVSPHNECIFLYCSLHSRLRYYKCALTACQLEISGRTCRLLGHAELPHRTNDQPPTYPMHTPPNSYQRTGYGKTMWTLRYYNPRALRYKTDVN